MKLLPSPSPARAEQRGAALMLSFMVLLVLILIVAQIRISTDTTARVARNEESLSSMDLAIESAFLQVFEDLKSDAQTDAGAAAGGESPGGPQGAGPSTGGGPVDSHEDEWAHPQRTELNEIQLRILIQDEDSKYNLLSVLTEDEEEADKALDRLARVIEWSRKGTASEIDGSTARRMAVAMADYLRRRQDQVVPKPVLLSDRDDDDVGAPLSLREFVAVDPELFPPDVFRDFVDDSDTVVHSLGAFLTVWSSVATLEEANAAATEPQSPPEEKDDEQKDGEEDQKDEDDPGSGQDQGNGQEQPAQNGEQEEDEPPPGWAINVNTAPGAVLHSLMEDRDLPYRFWDDVVLYRNTEDEAVEENDDPPKDEYGQDILVHQYFHSVDELSNVDGWENLEPIVKGELKALLKTESQVFSIYITARKPTGEEQINPSAREEDIEREEENWSGLVRTVRAVVWRRSLGEGEVEIVPLVRWEVLDYAPYEVLDFPETRRAGSR